MKATVTGILLLVSALPVFAGTSPTLNLIEPRGAPRGTELDLELYGERLDGAQELLQYAQGIEIRSLAVADDKHVTAKVFIRPDAPLGEHGMRLRTAGGTSFLRSFFVGQFPTVMEAEPNNTFAQSQKIAPDTTVQGISKGEDADYYVCSFKKGERLSVEMEAMRLGRTMFDASISVIDPRGFEISSCDDCALLRNDPFVSLLAPEDGDYRIFVRECSYEGSDACEYRLSVGHFPRPKAVYPNSARPGETVEFRFIGDPSGDFTQTITIPTDVAGRYSIFPERDGLLAPSPHWIQISPLPVVLESGSNNKAADACAMAHVPSAACGILSAPDEVDFFSFHATKGENLTLNVIARDLRSPLDSVISVRDSKGKNLANNDDKGNNPDSSLQWTAPEDGDYVAAVRDQLKRGGPDFTYRLEIVHRDPAIAASLPVVERNNSQKWKVFDVPRGNRYAAVINLSREYTACDLNFTADALPPGVTLDTRTVPKSVASFPVVFEAAADAPVGGGLYGFTIKATGDGPPLLGTLRDTVNHVEVNNQGPFHSAESGGIPVCVTEEIPFRLELEGPVNPVVRNGTINLKVRAVRREDYKEAITLRFLWNPPGIGAPSTITMAGDQSEASYEVNANNDAAPGEWPVCVLGEANTPKGPVLASTGLVTLRVAEPYLTMAIDMAATEQGKPVVVLAKLDQQTKYEGDATAELLGLPHGVTAKPVTFNSGAAELQIPLEVAADATIGKHTSLFCRVTVPQNGQGILHSVGGQGTLRIDKPAEDAPPQVALAEKPETPAPAAAPAERPLSRLEQLRLKGK